MRRLSTRTLPRAAKSGRADSRRRRKPRISWASETSACRRKRYLMIGTAALPSAAVCRQIGPNAAFGAGVEANSCPPLLLVAGKRLPKRIQEASPRLPGDGDPAHAPCTLRHVSSPRPSIQRISSNRCVAALRTPRGCPRLSVDQRAGDRSGPVEDESRGVSASDLARELKHNPPCLPGQPGGEQGQTERVDRD